MSQNGLIFYINNKNNVIYLGEGAQHPIARVILAASLVLYVVAYSSFFPFIFPYK